MGIQNEMAYKAKVPGAAYFREIESFMEDDYTRGKLFMEFCRDAGVTVGFSYESLRKERTLNS